MPDDEKKANDTTPEKALSYVPVLLMALTRDPDGATLCQMLGELLQATRNGGYQDGFNDAMTKEG